MESRTRCPSEDWDDYCSQGSEDPRAEDVAEWIERSIEVRQRSIKGGEYNVRVSFHQKDGFPDDPHDVATGVSEWLAKHPALFEVAYVLANKGDE